MTPGVPGSCSGNSDWTNHSRSTLALYWSHCVSDLADFIESTRLAPEH